MVLLSVKKSYQMNANIQNTYNIVSVFLKFIDFWKIIHLPKAVNSSLR